MNARSVCGPDELGDLGAVLPGGRSGRPHGGPADGRQQPGRSAPRTARGWPGRSRAVRGARDSDDLAALAGDNQGAVPAFDAQGLDVSASGFGDAQPVDGQQGDQRVLDWRAEPGGDQQRAEPRYGPGRWRATPAIRARPSDVNGRRVIKEFFFRRRSDRTQRRCTAAGSPWPGTAAAFQIAGKAFTVRAAGLEQAQVALLAPAGEPPQVQLA